MIEYQQLKEDLLQRLAKLIEVHGFVMRARTQSFDKRTPFGKLALLLAFIPHRADFDIAASVAIRFNELEDLINEGNDLLSKPEKRQTFSLGADLGNISDGKQKRWTVSNPADVEAVAESIMDFFVAIGIPYLEKYSDMEIALEAFSGEDTAARLHEPFHDSRAKRAIGLAFLLGHRERFSKLAASKTEFLTSRNDFGLQSFLQLRDSLERRLEAASLHQISGPSIS
ncbi:MAG TPA: hypothetical protein VFB82_09990 [Blastocatellia bacterium]|nr:hypothetical protein [Blastocatellia bacterium]